MANTAFDDSAVPSLQLDDVLTPTGPWAYLVAGTEAELEAAPALAIRFQPSPVAIRFIRGHRCDTVDRLYQEWAAALQFPWYFGWNWDAFDECIRDLEWLPADAWILVITNIVDLLADDHGGRRTCLDVLVDTAAYWSVRAPSFRVIFHCNAASEPTARSLLDDAGIRPAIRRTG
jgi:hypothetical protein